MDDLIRGPETTPPGKDEETFFQHVDLLERARRLDACTPDEPPDGYSFSSTQWRIMRSIDRQTGTPPMPFSCRVEGAGRAAAARALERSGILVRRIRRRGAAKEWRLTNRGREILAKARLDHIGRELSDEKLLTDPEAVDGLLESFELLRSYAGSLGKWINEEVERIDLFIEFLEIRGPEMPPCESCGRASDGTSTDEAYLCDRCGPGLSDLSIFMPAQHGKTISSISDDERERYLLNLVRNTPPARREDLAREFEEAGADDDARRVRELRIPLAHEVSKPVPYLRIVLKAIEKAMDLTREGTTVDVYYAISAWNAWVRQPGYQEQVREFAGAVDANWNTVQDAEFFRHDCPGVVLVCWFTENGLPMQRWVVAPENQACSHVRCMKEGPR